MAKLFFRYAAMNSGKSTQLLQIANNYESMAKPGHEQDVIRVLHKWGLDAVSVGEVTNSGRFIGRWHGEVVIDLPIQPLADAAPKYDRPKKVPEYLATVAEAPYPTDLQTQDLSATLQSLIQTPTLASKHWILRQYDGTVRGNTLLGMGEGDAGLIRIKNEDGSPSGKVVAVTSDCNSRFCYLDPFWGAAHAVAEACRNLSCVGAEPIGLTDCLNYGNPEKPENMWTFEQGCLGIRQACLALGVPVVSGNVSLYNDTEGQSIFPTPMIGAVGLIERCFTSVPLEEDHPESFSANVNYYSGSSFRSAADVIYLLGTTRNELGGSEYLKWRLGRVTGPCPELHLDDELSLQQCLREGIRMGLIRSAHDLSEGGLLIGCVESAFQGNLGFQLELRRGHLRLDSLLFGESASRAVISVHGEAIRDLEQLAHNYGVPFTKLGVVGGKSFSVSIDDVKVLDIPCVDLQRLHRGALERQLGLTS